MSGTPAQIARAAGLHYVRERRRGIRRIKHGRGFRYEAPPRVVLQKHLKRIHQLAIPPAWTNVWICPNPKGHLQATGEDVRGRLQYLYHAEWTASCERAKFRRIVDFALVLPRIRRQVARDLARRQLSRQKVLAAVVRLLERSLIRVGSDEYTTENGSYGLTTLRKKHVRVVGREKVKFKFFGKSKIEHDIEVFAPQVAAVIRRCQRLPGRDLFQYEADDGVIHDLTAADVNEYLQAAAKSSVTAKDFRTWVATVLMHSALVQAPETTSKRAKSRAVRDALSFVAGNLGNTVAVCRRSYVHPQIEQRYLKGRMAKFSVRKPIMGRRGLSGIERATLQLLK